MSVRGANPFDKSEVEAKHGRIRVSAKEDRTVDGIVFASKWEARCYKELKSAFKPQAFSLQPRVELQPKFTGPDGEKVRSCEYRGDFLFGPARDNPASPLTHEHVLIDAKGMEDPVYKMKSKMLRFRYNKSILLIKRVKDLKAVIEDLKIKYPDMVQLPA
jgi:hypothetical protein